MVKEWFVFPGNKLQEPDLVSPVLLGLPGIMLSFYVCACACACVRACVCVCVRACVCVFRNSRIMLKLEKIIHFCFIKLVGPFWVVSVWCLIMLVSPGLRILLEELSLFLF